MLFDQCLHASLPRWLWGTGDRATKARGKVGCAGPRWTLGDHHARETRAGICLRDRSCAATLCRRRGSAAPECFLHGQRSASTFCFTVAKRLKHRGTRGHRGNQSISLCDLYCLCGSLSFLLPFAPLRLFLPKQPDLCGRSATQGERALLCVARSDQRESSQSDVWAA